MRAKLILAAALLVVPLAIAGYAIADSGGRNDAAEAQSATARYHDLQNALDDGYSELPAVQDTSTVKATNGCASSKLGAGGMGIHFLKGPLDDVVDAQHPEVLVYEPQANGRMKLVALEYVSTRLRRRCSGRSSARPTSHPMSVATRARTSPGRCTRGSGRRTRPGC